MKLNSNLTIGSLLFVIAAIWITLFSACSPIYPLNPWDDANIFMAIGQSLHHGAHLYTDVFDHKGPLLYLLHQWSSAWFSRPFAGIYLVQIICLWGYLFYAWLTTQLFGKKWIALPFIILLGLMYVTSDFYYYGDTAEELGLPWIMFSLYHLLRYVRFHQLPSPVNALIMGIGIAILFWIKFTLLSPFVGAFIFLLYLCIHRRTMTDFWKVLGWTMAGFIGLTMMVIIYYVCIGGLADVMDGYFGFNLFRYHGINTSAEKSEMGIYPIRLLVWLILVAIPWLHFKVNKDVRYFVTCSFATTMILFATTTVYIYYFIICFAFFPLAYYYVRKWALNKTTIIIGIAVAIILIITDFNLMQLCRHTFPQKILTVVEKIQPNSGDKEVLTYRSRETGYYTYSKYLPPIRFFFLTSMVHQALKDDQDACLRSRQCRYVIVKDQVLAPEVYDAIEENGYTLIEQEEELFRTLRLLNPKLFFWNLGWPQPIMRLFLDEEPQPQKAIFRLYERNQ